MKEWMKKGVEKIKKHAVLWSICFAFITATILVIGIGVINAWVLSEMYMGAWIWILIVAGCIIYPPLLTFINLAGIFCMPKEGKKNRCWAHFAWITVLLGGIDSALYLMVASIRTEAEWSTAIYAIEMHQPIWTGGLPTVIVLSVVGAIGYLVLSMVKLEKMPPLVTVLSISGMYLGILECVLWSIQVMEEHWVLSLFPINCILLAVRMIRLKMMEWKMLQQERNANPSDYGVFGTMNRILNNATLWPAYAFLLMWPLLGILLCILVLFGQRPDAVIKAWTETADWRLSQQTPPPDLPYDGHYLCTVAAGGHQKLVKPIRLGERHGHLVVVNRQLCIANAFEQILEERTPRFHRVVRNFYDTYGFPIAKLIRTKGAADFVYIVMKPLEWMFLIVLYLCDVNPENRIAVQYLPKRSRQEK